MYLIRHAEVVVDEAAAAHEWRLSEDGRRAARELASAPCWRRLAAVVSSPEPKARSTADPIAAAARLAVEEDEGLREVRRNATWTAGANAYIALVASYFGGTLPDWEPPSEAQTRIVHSVERAWAEVDGSLCAVSHGLLLSLFLAWLDGRGAPTLEEWMSISLPAVAVADPTERRLVRPFSSAGEFLASPEAQ